MTKLEFLEIGKIVKAHGLNGRVKVLSFMQSSDLLKSLKEIFIRRDDDGMQSHFKLESAQAKGNCFYLDIEGISSLEQAESLVGCTVIVSVENVPPLQEDEYYWEELIGLEVFTEEGSYLGKVENIFPTGSNDVYVCSGIDKEILLPAISDVIQEIDLEKRMLVVRLLKGM